MSALDPNPRPQRFWGPTVTLFNGSMEAGDTDLSGGGVLADVTRAARGWHGVQLAVLAFIGLCGVLTNGDEGTPRGLQVTAGVLAIVALALSCLSIFLVASVAWPFSTAASDVSSDTRTRDSAPGARRLRLGVGLTYVAVGTMALAASIGWWPTEASTGTDDDGGASVEITDGSGRTACGELVEGPAGKIRLETDAGTVEITTSGVARIAPVPAC